MADAALIASINERRLRQIPLSLRGFFGKDMTFISVLALNFARSRQLEALFCSAVGFYFWHSVIFLVLLTFGGFRRKYDTHPLAFQLRKLIDLAVVLELLREFQQQNLSAFLEYNRPPDEVDIGLHLCPIFQKIYRMLEFKVEIMIVGIWPEPDFFHHRFLSLGFYLLLLFLLFVFEFGIVNHLTNRRIGIRRNLDKIETQVLCDLNSIAYRVNADGDIFTYHTHLSGIYSIIDTVRFLYATPIPIWVWFVDFLPPFLGEY